MLLGVVNFLQSGKNPLFILIQEVVKFHQVTALNEVLLAVQVFQLYHFSTGFQTLGKFVGPFFDYIFNILLLEQGLKRKFIDVRFIFLELSVRVCHCARKFSHHWVEQWLESLEPCQNQVDVGIFILWFFNYALGSNYFSCLIKHAGVCIPLFVIHVWNFSKVRWHDRGSVLCFTAHVLEF